MSHQHPGEVLDLISHCWAFGLCKNWSECPAQFWRARWTLLQGHSSPAAQASEGTMNMGQSQVCWNQRTHRERQVPGSGTSSSSLSLLQSQRPDSPPQQPGLCAGDWRIPFTLWKHKLPSQPPPQHAPSQWELSRAVQNWPSCVSGYPGDFYYNHPQ